ncbi:hypothetical protein [Longimycelium tulufanense]|nr:hypothetical protein [Longimycelium tulufanense]
MPEPPGGTTPTLLRAVFTGRLRRWRYPAPEWARQSAQMVDHVVDLIVARMDELSVEQRAEMSEHLVAMVRRAQLYHDYGKGRISRREYTRRLRALD